MCYGLVCDFLPKVYILELCSNVMVFEDVASGMALWVRLGPESGALMIGLVVLQGRRVSLSFSQ